VTQAASLSSFPPTLTRAWRHAGRASPTPRGKPLPLHIVQARMQLPLRTLTAGGSSMCTPRGFRHLGRSQSTIENLTICRVFLRVCGRAIPPLGDTRRDRICLLDSVYDIICCTISTIIVSRAPSTSEWAMPSANIPAGEHCCRQARREEPLTFNVTM
jgi:hypothetical protein